MEMLVFFLISLCVGVLAAYFAEQNRHKQDAPYRFRNKQNEDSRMSRLQKISRSLKST